MLNVDKIVIVKKEEKVIGYEIKDISNYIGYDGERALSHSFLLDSFRKLLGKTLTIIDASISDKVQNKAVKDMVRNAFSDEIEFSSEWAFDQEIICKEANRLAENIEANDFQEVEVDEMLGVK